MLMCLGAVLSLGLIAAAGIAISLMIGYLMLTIDRDLRLSKLSLSLFCVASIAGMIAYALSLDSLRITIVFFDDIPEFVHAAVLVLCGAGIGWLFLRILALMHPAFRAPRG